MRFLVIMVLGLAPWIANADSVSKSIHIGSCGGITGACTGRVIKEDGTVYAVRQPLGEVEDQQVVCCDKEIANHLFQELVKIDFENLKIKDHANMTSYIRVNYGSISHSVSWWKDERTPNVDKVSLALSKFYREVFDLLKSKNCEPPATRR